MGSSAHQKDQSKDSGLSSHSNGFVGESQGGSDDLPPKESMFPARELQKRFQGKLKDFVLLAIRIIN
jgi:hypothetical protein